LMLPPTMPGITEASTTLSRSTPSTRTSPSTTAAIWRDHQDWHMIAPKHPEEQTSC
jgi:hypothetical protein